MPRRIVVPLVDAGEFMVCRMRPEASSVSLLEIIVMAISSACGRLRMWLLIMDLQVGTNTACQRASILTLTVSNSFIERIFTRIHRSAYWALDSSPSCVTTM